MSLPFELLRVLVVVELCMTLCLGSAMLHVYRHSIPHKVLFAMWTWGSIIFLGALAVGYNMAQGVGQSPALEPLAYALAIPTSILVILTLWTIFDTPVKENPHDAHLAE